MDKQQAYQAVRHYLREWEQMLAAVDEVQARLGMSEVPGPDMHTLQSGPPIGAEGVEEIRKAENRVLCKWEELQEAVDRWNGMVLRKPAPVAGSPQDPPGEYARPGGGVWRHQPGGNWPLRQGGTTTRPAGWNSWLDFQRPLGLKFFGMDRELSDLLGVKVSVVTKSVIEEREPHLLDGAVSV